MADLCWKGGIPYFCIYDRGRFFPHIQCPQVYKPDIYLAIVSEIPFNLIYGSSLIYPFHQNVLWTFLIALLCITFLGKIKKGKMVGNLAGHCDNSTCWLSLGTITMVDYYGAGVLTVLTFYISTKENGGASLTVYVLGCIKHLVSAVTFIL